jgi:hypothetical protein
MYVPLHEEKDDEANTNPDLFSDAGSNISSRAATDDGAFPLPADAASDGGSYKQVGCRGGSMRLNVNRYESRYLCHESIRIVIPKLHPFLLTLVVYLIMSE